MAEPAMTRPVTTQPLLQAKGLNVVYEPARGSRIWSVRDVRIDLAEGELAGLVGESGCGKSTLGYALTRMLRPPARLESGTISFGGEDLASLEGEELRQLRRGGFALVPQSGMNALSPVRTVGAHFRDVLRTGKSSAGAAAAKQVQRRAAELLDRVQLPAATLRRYPHELSGGMRQRAVIAIALALDPRLVIFDEPTTALDVIVADAVLGTIRELQAEAGFTALLISHDLGLVLRATDRVLVMYAGRIVEDQPAASMLADARHPYSQALLRCYGDPRADEVHIEGIPGSPPDLSMPPGGCAFGPRCPLSERVCEEADPGLAPLGGGLAACHVAVREAGHASR